MKNFINSYDNCDRFINITMKNFINSYDNCDIIDEKHDNPELALKVDSRQNIRYNRDPD